MRDSGRRGAGGGALSRLPLASWRLFLASCAILAVGNTATALDLWWEGFGQQVVVAVALVYFALAWVGLAWPARSWPWLRGALATSLLLATAAHLFEGGSLTSAWAPLVHAVVPALVVADYLAVGRSAGKWWWPLTWTLLPLAYLVYYASAGLLFYEFLDPVDSSYQVAVLGFLLADAAIGFVLFGLAGGRQSTYDHDISLSGR
ncbi:MAG TPA: hypothetical protein VFY58_09785 [Nocardioides sp.]|nr:hypothetical protein [Nocardioides sp.]